MVIDCHSFRIGFLHYTHYVISIWSVIHLVVCFMFLEDTRSYDSKWDFLKYWLGSGIGAALITIILYTPIIIYNYDRFFGNGFIAPLEWDIFPNYYLDSIEKYLE